MQKIIWTNTVKLLIIYFILSLSVYYWSIYALIRQVIFYDINII